MTCVLRESYFVFDEVLFHLDRVRPCLRCVVDEDIELWVLRPSPMSQTLDNDVDQFEYVFRVSEIGTYDFESGFPFLCVLFLEIAVMGVERVARGDDDTRPTTKESKSGVEA